MTPDEPTGDAPEATTETTETQFNEDGTVKKKRRRRGKRGGRGRNKAKSDANATGEPQAERSEERSNDEPKETKAETRSERSSESDGEGDEKPRRRGSRGGRGRKGSGDKPSGRDRDRDRDRNRDRAPARSKHDDADDDYDPMDDQPRRGTTRATPDISAEDWEDIYDKQTFADLGLRNSLLKSLDEAGYKHPTKIQAELIPLVIGGRDVLGQSRTGTGKTAAFGLPLYNQAKRGIPFQTLVLCPTRELAIQIAKEFEMLGRHTPLKVVPVYGGQRIPAQIEKLKQEPEIIVATPGRFMDLLERRELHVKNIRFAVLDEVDRMLDIGFRDDIRKILSSIKSEHQTVFVSATISDEIEKLAKKFMNDPAKLVMTSGSLTVQMVDQSYVAVERWDKKRLLTHWIKQTDPELAIVFCRMKRTVDDLVQNLAKRGIESMGIHGDLYQSKRNTVMKKLRDGELSVVIASDLAARGLDVDGITHVINYDLPDDPEVYIHRIGRTARAGRRGTALSFVSPDQGELLTTIEQLANAHVAETTVEGFEPGPIPQDIVREQEEDEKKLEAKRAMNRYALSNSLRLSDKEKKDAAKFPGGIVPTKLPPKKMQGRVMTTRSVKKMMEKPAADEPSKD